MVLRRVLSAVLWSEPKSFEATPRFTPASVVEPAVPASPLELVRPEYTCGATTATATAATSRPSTSGPRGGGPESAHWGSS